MKIALAQFNPTVGDFAGNTARILSLAAQAQERGAALAVFTELCLCGYPPQDLLERHSRHVLGFGHQATIATCLRIACVLPQPVRMQFVRTALYANGFRDY